MIWIIITLSIIIIIQTYIIYNVLKKNETFEDIMVGYQSYLNKFSEIIELSDSKLKQIDQKGSFKSDDEIGFFFENIKEIQTILNEFNVKNF